MSKKIISKKVQNKFFNDQYIINSPYYKNEGQIKILIIGDMHFHENVPKTIFENLIINTKNINPDFIVMPGDLIETNKFLDNPTQKDFFEYIIKSLSSIAPVIITAGNHEIANYNLEISRNETSKTIKYLESFNKYPNIYFLNNKQINFNNINFVGFTPSLNYYYNYNKGNSENIAIDEYEKSKLKMNKDNYNILISHVVLKNYRDKDITDLTISGHWHDGYIPKKLDRFFENTDKGIFFENFPKEKSRKVKYARGVHEFGRGYSITTQGYRKYTADIKLFNLLEGITANDTETIIIEKGSSKVKKI